MHIEAIKLRDEQFFSDPTQFRLALFSSVSAENFWAQLVHQLLPVTLELTSTESSSVITAVATVEPTVSVQCTGSALLMTSLNSLVLTGTWATNTLTVASHTLLVGDRVFVSSQYATVTAVTATTVTVDVAGAGGLVVAPVVVATSTFDVDLIFPASSSSTLAVIVETRNNEI